MAVRLLIVDDQEIICSGLRALLAGTELEIVGCATTPESARRHAAESAPNVALVDVGFGQEGGFQLARQLREAQPELGLVFYTAFDNPRFAAVAASMGAGCVSQGADRATLLATVTSAGAGTPSRARRPAPRLPDKWPTPADDPQLHLEVALTEREHQVLAKMAEGLTNKQIAQVLEISYETVKEHVQHVLQKIGVADRTQAAVWAVRRHLI